MIDIIIVERTADRYSTVSQTVFLLIFLSVFSF